MTVDGRTATFDEVKRTPEYTSGATISIKPVYSIIIYKQDSVMKKGLDGVTFEITSPTGISTTYTTATNSQGDQGYINTGILDEGTYRVREISTLDAYQLDSQVREVTVGKDGSVIYWGNTPKTKIPTTAPSEEKPELTLYSIQFRKVGESGQALAGATFDLYDGDEVIMTVTSDENGQVTFAGVEAKDYTIKETAAPEGYQLLEESISVSKADFADAKDLVLTKGDVVNVKVPEAPEPTTPSTPKTSEPTQETKRVLPSTGEQNSMALIALGLLGLASVGWMVFRKRN